MKRLICMLTLGLMYFALMACGSSTVAHSNQGEFPSSAAQVKAAFLSAPQNLSSINNSSENTVPYVDPAKVNSNLRIETGSHQFDRHVRVYLGDTQVMAWPEVLNGFEIYHGTFNLYNGANYVLYGNAHAAGDPWGQKYLFVYNSLVSLPRIDYQGIENVYLVSDIRQFDDLWLIVKLESGENGEYYVQDRVAHWFMYNVKSQEWRDFGVYGKARE